MIAMVYVVTSMRDEVHQEFQGLTLEISNTSAIRNFNSAYLSSQAKQEGLLYSHPGDFSLWKVGEFDSETASFNSCVPELIIRGSDFNA